MPNIINTNDFYRRPLTVDTTLITVDTTEITVDQTYIQTNQLYIKIMPSSYPIDVNITFLNELTEVEYTEQCITVTTNGWMVVPFEYKEFKEGDSFEVWVRNLNGKQIWRGKVYVTDQTDLQNYELIPSIQNNNRKIYEL